MEIEVFVHGALCIAYSGRCLLSGYMTHRDSNQGACTNSCRWKYQAHEAKQTDSGDIVPAHNIPVTNTESHQATQFDPAEFKSANKNDLFLLQERSRPDDFLPAYEDEHGTYIMNSKDLRAVQHVQRLIDIGVESLKIEGRTKSYYYVARTAQVYRQAIRDAEMGKQFDMGLMTELEGLASRGYTEGFYRRHIPSEFQNYEQGNSTSDKQQFVGEVIAFSHSDHSITVDVKNKFSVGDELQLLTPTGNIDISLTNMVNKKGAPVEVAPGSGHVVSCQIPELSQLAIKDDDTDTMKHALLVKNL